MHTAPVIPALPAVSILVYIPVCILRRRRRLPLVMSYDNIFSGRKPEVLLVLI